MRKTLLLGSVIITAILFGACTQEKTVETVSKPAVATATTSPKPAVKASPVAATEEPEVKAITSELKDLDASKDFAAYSTTDIQP